MSSEITFNIPKTTDRLLLSSVFDIQQVISDFQSTTVKVKPNSGTPNPIPVVRSLETTPEITEILDLESETFCDVVLYQANHPGHSIFSVNRLQDKPYDTVKVSTARGNGHWLASLEENTRDVVLAKVVAAARKHLKASDMDASLSGTSDSAWSRYRDSQQLVIDSLNNAVKTILVESSKKISEAETKYRNESAGLKNSLEQEYANLKSSLELETGDIRMGLDLREIELKKKEQEFETKEARYVARQQQNKQIEKIENWIENWTLTKPTTRKRKVIHVACIVFAIAFFSLTVCYANQVNHFLLTAIENKVVLHWWQWLVLVVKPVIPFVFFAATSAFYIKWSVAWANEHAEEEFRNRIRLLDVGRSQWLLEAMRDAQDHEQEFPKELIHELSKNLFSSSSAPVADQELANSVGRVLMQGLSSIRVKSSDGSEIEARSELEKAKK